MILVHLATLMAGFVGLIAAISVLIEDIETRRHKGGHLSPASRSDVAVDLLCMLGAAAAMVTALWAITHANW